jgi:alpha-N-arabinofuranosidase
MKNNSRRIKCLLVVFLIASASMSCNTTSKKAINSEDKGNAIKMVNNPILKGFNPDPSVCKVGDDYYMAISTFEYFPGVPVYHSKDLINWKMIGHAIHRTNQLDFSEIPATHGVFAPTIRYHKGTYYMITTFVTRVKGQKSISDVKGGNFIVTANNPAGPWSDPHWIDNAPGIDPSLFFDDDGKVYYTGNRTAKDPIYRAQKEIWTQEIDLENFELKGPTSFIEAKPYYENKLIGSALAFEGPHLYKKDGIYYMVISHGGTGMWHSVSIWKSDTPMGPWEINPDNPILTHYGYENSGINCTGHADFFQTEQGDWYTVFLGVRSTENKFNVMGRETFLSPVDWSGVWPVVNAKRDTGRAELVLPAPAMFKGEQNNFNFRDDFEQDELGLNWTFLRNPKSTWWDLSSNKGMLNIKLRPQVIDDFSQPSFVGIRVVGMKVKFETQMNFIPKTKNECAGLALFRGHKPNWSLVKELHDNKPYASVYYMDSLISRTPIFGGNAIGLKIELNDFHIDFFVKEKAKEWQKVGEADGSEMKFPPAGRFTGAFCGLYATSRGDNSSINVASFDWYEMKE